MKVELIKKIKEAEDSFSFIFKPEKEIFWKPGKFIFYEIPHKDPDSRGIKRHFTISSAPYEKYIMLTSKFDFKKGSSFRYVKHICGAKQNLERCVSWAMVIPVSSSIKRASSINSTFCENEKKSIPVWELMKRGSESARL